ncbi:MAG: hypothetical protein H0W46_11760 [Acidimicrobiia bacterium]|nr:hypothetical protein [Acidimicrobiia bacterium]
MKVARFAADSAAAVGVGLLAGVVGTAAMTAVSTAEAKLTGRSASTTPADAGGTALGVQPKDEQHEARFSNIMHWAYGTAWGGFRGLLGQLGMRGPVAAVTHLGALWAGDQVVLPATNAAPPAWKWGTKDIAMDLAHHAVYAAAAGAAYDWLDRRRS